MIRGSKSVIAVSSLVVVGAVQTVAHAKDVTFGGNARAFAMGGAGVAVVDRSERSNAINPASLALTDRKSKLSFPQIGVAAHGIPIKQAYDHLIRNPSSNDAVSLARDFGNQDSSFGAGVAWGLKLGHNDITATGIGEVRVQPNISLINWSNTANGNVALLTGNERADIIGAAIYSLPIVGVAERVSPLGSPTQVDAGARVKLSRAMYSHYVVNSTNIAANTGAAPAPEMNGDSVLGKNGIGIDVGFLVHPAHHTGLSGAIVITDLLEPNFRFNGTDRTGAAAKYDLQPRSITLGSAYENGRVLVAADIVDITRAYGNVQGRTGIEYRVKKFAFQTGYSSARGFTAGVGYRAFQIAVGSRTPLEIAQTLRF